MIERRGRYNSVRTYKLKQVSSRFLKEDYDYIRKLVIDGYFINISEVIRFSLMQLLLKDSFLENFEEKKEKPSIQLSFFVSDKLRELLLKKYDKEVKKYYLTLKTIYKLRFKDGFGYIAKNAIHKFVEYFKQLKLEEIERDG